MTTDARFKISEVLDLKGATSIGNPNPINRGPISFAPPYTFISLVEIAAVKSRHNQNISITYNFRKWISFFIDRV